MLKSSGLVWFRGLSIATSLFAMTACNDTGFSLLQTASQKDVNPPTGSPSSTPTDPEKVVCDPLNPQNQTDPKLGIKSSLSFIEDFVIGGAYPVTSCTEFASKGKKLDLEVFLADLNVTPRNFDAGFENESGNLIQKADGTDLVEWFMLQGESKIQLGANDAPGFYQLAAISDDGIVVQLGDAQGNFSSVIDNQYPHSATMNCATKSISLARGESIPMHFSYYQGPRVRVALMLMWRKVDASVAAKDAECQQGRGDDYFFNGNVAPSAPLAPYQGLVARGWAPLKADNFLLASGVNKCALAN